MAGRGPAPKPAADRRRRNPKKDEEELPAEGYTGEYPELPASYRITAKTKKGTRLVKRAFLPETREWYEAWATSPMATRFTAPTWQRLLRLARLVDQYERQPDKQILGEVRLQEAALGGTPADLLRLGLKVAAPAEPAPVVSLVGRQQNRDRHAVDPVPADPPAAGG